MGGGEEAQLEEILRDLGRGAAALYAEQVSALGATPHPKGGMLAALYALGHGVAPSLRLEDWKAWVPHLCDLAIHSAPDFELPTSEQTEFTTEVAGFALDVLRGLHRLAEAEEAGGGAEAPGVSEAQESLAELYRRALAVSLGGGEPGGSGGRAGAGAAALRAPVEDAQSRYLTIWSMMREDAARREG